MAPRRKFILNIMFGIFLASLIPIVSVALTGNIFTDDTDMNFSLGNLTNTNISGSGVQANVTLNFTTSYKPNVAYPVYNLTGNFTSRIFDTRQNHSVFDKIEWKSTLPNSSDVIGYATHGGANDVGVFYRNGSIGTNTNQPDFASDFSLTTGLRLYTIPVGFKREDIIGFGWDDDSGPNLYAFFNNGSVAIDAGQASLTTDVAFTTTSSYTIPSGFNASNIIGFAFDSIGNGGSVGNAAAFFSNGSYLRSQNTETGPWTFSSVLTYSLPAGFNAVDAIGTDYYRAVNSVAMFFRNGSYLSNTSQTDFNTNFVFSGVHKATYHSDANITITTNISLQTRISNDSSSWSAWSSDYINSIGTQLIEKINARYIQYRAVFFTPDKYYTPFLDNVSMNYTIDLKGPEVNVSINDTTLRFGDSLNISANLSDPSGLNTCQFIDNETGSKRFFNISVPGINNNCTQKYNITIGRGSVVNFSLVVNDTYDNKNQTDFIINTQNNFVTMTNQAMTSPVSLVAGDSITLTCNATLSDNDTIEDISNVNASFYYSSAGGNAPDDNNNHYSNSSCYAFSNSTFESNYTCSFGLKYYANNGTWKCNITSIDIQNFINFTAQSTIIDELMAIDVSPLSLDYGKLSPSEISSNNTNLTIRNLGNIPINVTLRGYAPNESFGYLNLSMTCQNGNISNANQRYSIFNGTDFSQMNMLNNESVKINFTLPQRTNSIQPGNDTNYTFWNLKTPPGIGGLCNGTLLFSAVKNN